MNRKQPNKFACFAGIFGVAIAIALLCAIPVANAGGPEPAPINRSELDLKSNKANPEFSGEVKIGTTVDQGGYELQVMGDYAAYFGHSADCYVTIENQGGGDCQLMFRSGGANKFFLGYDVTGGTNRYRFYSYADAGVIFSLQEGGGAVFEPQSAAPPTTAGCVYYDSDDNKLKVYNGSTWVDLH